MKDFLSHNIGKIVKIHNTLDFAYDVDFFKPIPSISDSTIFSFERDEIIEWSYDKDTLKINQDINKYNL